ncbi:uncharacterized protein LOC143880556 [Tasmannia lanceolata]|uniref:uncharacterized protein LOC143880556 n=1 Tax=Tasmannia lanceolata TaxID=3420 RepID=UPI00406406EA
MRPKSALPFLLDGEIYLLRTVFSSNEPGVVLLPSFNGDEEFVGFSDFFSSVSVSVSLCSFNVDEKFVLQNLYCSFNVDEKLGVLQGFLDEQFVQLEELQDDVNPNFVEEVVTLFFKDSARLVVNIEQALEKRPLDFSKLDTYMHQFKGSSSR